MQIVELGDCSMVIMKDSDDPWYHSMGDYYRLALDHYHEITVSKRKNEFSRIYRKSKDFVCTAGRLILFFPNNVNDVFNVHDKVELFIL